MGLLVQCYGLLNRFFQLITHPAGGAAHFLGFGEGDFLPVAFGDASLDGAAFFFGMIGVGGVAGADIHHGGAALRSGIDGGAEEEEREGEEKGFQHDDYFWN